MEKNYFNTYSGHVRRIIIIKNFRNAVNRIKAPAYDCGHVKYAICIGRTLVEEGFYFGHLRN
jgi:hypothetical protein